MQFGWSHKTEFGWFASVGAGVLGVALFSLIAAYGLVDRYESKVASGLLKPPASITATTKPATALVMGASIGDVPDSAAIMNIAAALKLELSDLPWNRMLIRRSDKAAPMPLQSIFFPVNSADEAFALCAKFADVPPGCTTAIASTNELYLSGLPVSTAMLEKLQVAPYVPEKKITLADALKNREPATPARVETKIVFMPAPSVPAITPEQAPLKLQPGIAAPAEPGAQQIWLSKTIQPGDAGLTNIVAAGDTMLGSVHTGLNPAIRPNTDVSSLVGASLAGLFRKADIAFLNLEGPLYDGVEQSGKNCANCFSFRSPTFYSGIFANLGIDVVSLANNHSGDYGEAGRAATMAALKASGIAYGGLDRDGARQAELLLPGGRKAAMLAFAPNSGTLNLNDLPRARALVAEAKRTHDLVIVSFHGGGEGWANVHVANKTEIYVGENRGNVVAFAHAAIDAGADLVIGHGPHVPRAVEIYKDHLIAYSLGNFWTYDGVMNYAVSGLGPVLDAWLAPDGSIAGFTIHSTRQAGLGVPRLDPVNEAARYVMYLTKTDFPATNMLVERAGTPRAAAQPVPRQKS